MLQALSPLSLIWSSFWQGKPINTQGTILKQTLCTEATIMYPHSCYKSILSYHDLIAVVLSGSLCYVILYLGGSYRFSSLRHTHHKNKELAHLPIFSSVCKQYGCWFSKQPWQTTRYRNIMGWKTGVPSMEKALEILCAKKRNQNYSVACLACYPTTTATSLRLPRTVEDV
jgi:hypothetical protein